VIKRYGKGESQRKTKKINLAKRGVGWPRRDQQRTDKGVSKGLGNRTMERKKTLKIAKNSKGWARRK